METEVPFTSDETYQVFQMSMRNHKIMENTREFFIEFHVKSKHEWKFQTQDYLGRIINTWSLHNREDPPVVQKFWVNPKNLFGRGQESNVMISNMLSKVHIDREDFQEYMIPNILSYARSLLEDKKKGGDQLKIAMYVDIELTTEYMSYSEDNSQVSDEIMRESMEEFAEMGYGMIPASKSSIEKLDQVLHMSGTENCTICLERLPIGMLVTRMPCTHFFHKNCIVQWLDTSNSCPICRFALS